MRLTCPILFVLSTIAAASYGQKESKSPEIGSIAPKPANLVALKGNNLTAYTPGRITVIEFWATWCGPCRGVIPHLNELVKQYSGKAVDFYSVTAEGKAPYEQFASKFPIDTNVISDPKGGMFDTYGIHVIPRTVIIDGKGKVAAITNPEDVTAEKLDALLANKPVTFVYATSNPMSFDWDKETMKSSYSHVIIEPSISDSGGQRIPPNSGQITVDGGTLQGLIQLANDASYFDTVWSMGDKDTVKYRVSVKAPDKSDATARKMLSEALERLSSFRAEWEDIERDVYVLRKSGEMKLAPSKGVVGGFARSGTIKWTDASVEDFVRCVQSFGVGLTVVDESGLTGRFDLDMSWVPGSRGEFVKLMETLGFSLTKEKRKVRTLVIKPKV